MFREPRWRQEGTEPDYRFSPANERTFLACIRTALALLAGGVLLDQFAPRLQPPGAVLALATGLCSLAALLCATAYYRRRDNEIVMRHAGKLPFTRMLALLAIAMALVGGPVVFLLLPK